MKYFLYIVLFITLFHCSLSYGATNFNSPRDTAVPTLQRTLASGDLNKDGLLDLVVGGYPPENSYSGRVYVLLGKGNGFFRPPIEYRVGYNDNEVYSALYIQQIQIADMNNDGNLDTVVAHNGDVNILSNRSTVFVTVLFGNGDGTLQPSQGYSLYDGSSSNFVQAFTISDLDTDSLPDIALAINVGSDAARIWILKNSGNNYFQIRGPKPIGGNIYNIVGENFNGDNHNDLVMVTYSGTIIGYGNGTLFPVNYEIRDENIFEVGLVVKDLNSDGRQDFIVTPRNGREFRIFFNSSNGFPHNPIIYQIPSFLSGLSVTDFNRDGKPDLVCVMRNDPVSLNNLRIYYGDGAGNFTDTEEIVNTDNHPAFNGIYEDFNLDGKPDIVTVYGYNATVFLNSPNSSRFYSDFDGDLKSDFTVYRNATKSWRILFSNNYSSRSFRFGLPSDKFIPGNYDGDNKADIAVYRNGSWHILQSSNNLFRTESWGNGADIPVPADYENTGKLNLAVFRPSEGVWYIKKEIGFNAVKWGVATDKPVPADYDGDGKSDIAVWRPENGTWYLLNTRTNQFSYQTFGAATDKPVPADYDGDGKTDIAVWRSDESSWHILQSTSGLPRSERFGLPEDIPAPDDFDGDSKSDIAVYRPSEGIWYIRKSSTDSLDSVKWGTLKDIPIVSLK